MQHQSVNQYLRDHIRTVPDWPAPGVQFRDITPLLQEARVFRVLIDAFVHRYMDPDKRPDVVAGLDARGFILGAVVAYELNVGFVPIRKKGKLPFTTVEETYELEYGSATVELHTDAVQPGDRVLLIDDLIATGGTMMAGKKLLEKLGAIVTEGAAIVDLPELGGSEKLLADAWLSGNRDAPPVADNPLCHDGAQRHGQCQCNLRLPVGQLGKAHRRQRP
jgi:adenine phosphoribosyltransferase